MFHSFSYQRIFPALFFTLFCYSIQANDIWKDYTVKSGDNLSVIFKKVGLSIKDALEVNDATKAAKTFARMIPGETLSFQIKDNQLLQIRYRISPDVTLVINKESDKDKLYSVSREQAQLIDKVSIPNTQEFIDTKNYNAIEKQIFILDNNDTLAQVLEKAGLPTDHVDYLKNVEGSNTLFDHFKQGDQISLLIIDNSLLELIYQPLSGAKSVFTRSVEQPTLYKRSESSSDITALSKAISKPDINSNALDAQPQTEGNIGLQKALTQNPNKADNWVYYTVQPDDNLSTIFIKAGLSHSDVYYVDHATKSDGIFKNIQPGEKIGFLIRDSFLIRVKYIVNPLKSIIISRTDKSDYQVEILERTPETVIKYSQGSINSSLFVDAINAGLSNNLIMNFAKVFAWDIDFSQDIQPGDKFKVIYEEKTIDGSKIRDGNIIAAQFESGGKVLTGIFYTDTNGEPGFYTPEGKSMRKAFLRMPVEFARISSKFNPRRKHPIYNTIRAHNGVDYAAKTGTPIQASGNGKIIHMGRKGGYGKTIIIKHGENISTLYAHLSAYNKEIKVGSRVIQGQTIGYVGATGAATGPHLHYEFRVDGIHKNPLTVKLPKASALDDSEFDKFTLVANQALNQLSKYKEQEQEQETILETTATSQEDITNE